MTIEMLEREIDKKAGVEGTLSRKLAVHLPARQIKSKSMHRLYLGVITDLMILLNRDCFHGKEKTEIKEYIETVGHFIQEYEKVQFPLGKVEPHELLEFLMEQNGLGQEDLAGILGTSQPAVSQILKGKRDLTKEHIERLSKRFHLSPAAFFSEAA